MLTPLMLVNYLLESDPVTRVCAACAKEHGETARPGQSHGWCKRHYLEHVRDSAEFIGADLADQLLADAETAPPGFFVPD